MDSPAVEPQGDGDKMSWVSKYLSENDLKEIKQAVIQAERKTSGEVVPVLVFQSASYGHVVIVIFLFLLLLRSALGLSEFLSHHINYQSWYAFGEIIILGAISLFFSKSPILRRMLTSDLDIDRQVMLRAEAEMLRSRIHRTNQSTGILLFLSFTERSAVVLGDKAISDKCSPETWGEIVKILIDGIKQGKLKEGIINGIEKSADVLCKPFPRDDEDINELPDALVIKDN